MDLYLAAWITVVIGLVIMGFSIWFLRNNKIRLIPIAILIVTLSLSLISSYAILGKSFNAEKFQLLDLLNEPLIFCFNVLVKFLFCFWLVALGMGMLFPERISKIGANVFGVGVDNEFAKDVTTVKINLNEAKKQNDRIVNLNRKIFDQLVKNFEQGILESRDQAETIRNLIKSILVQTYGSENAAIYVLPINENLYDRIGEKLTALIQPLTLENRTIVKIENNNIGIGIIPSVNESATLIIIDTSKEKYCISDAEICAACSFFVAVVNTVNSALHYEKIAKCNEK